MIMRSLLAGWLLLIATAVSSAQQQSWPVPRIQSPAVGMTFAVDDELKLVGSATDGDGKKLPDSSLSWEIRYRNSKNLNHQTFLGPTKGNNIEINGRLEPLDLKSAKESYLEVLLTATNSAGLSTTTKLILKPRTVEVDFDTNPSGLDVVLNGETYATPVKITTWSNHKFNIKTTSQTTNEGSYKFTQWSDGGKRSHRYEVSSTRTTVVANFELALPEPRIASIEEGTRFSVGDSFVLVGSANDGFGNRLSDSSLTWAVRLYNEKEDNARTILKATEGNHLKFNTPEPKDFDEAESSYLQIQLTATDSNGMSSTKTFILEPNKVDLLFTSEPTGLIVTLDGNQFRTPAAVTSWENYKFALEAPSQKKRDAIYTWVSWSDSGTARHEYVTPPAKRFNPHTVAAVFGEPTPEEPQSNSSLPVGLFIGIAVLVLVLSAILFVVWRKKRGLSDGDDSDTSEHGDKSKKSADTGVLYSADGSDDFLSEDVFPKDLFQDSKSHPTVDEESGISGLAPSVAETSVVSSGSSSGSIDSILLPTPLNLSNYLLSANLMRGEEEGEEAESDAGVYTLPVSKGTEADDFADIPLSK